MPDSKAGKIKFDNVGERKYETGIDHGVLYKYADGVYKDGVAWNGLTSVSESPSGAENTDIYADNIKYLTLRSAEQLGLTIEAYTYPPEFEEFDGIKEIAAGVKFGQQSRGTFGLSYRTNLGTDTNPDAGYKLHLVYGCSASPSDRGYQTVNDSPEAITFSWEISTTPVLVDNYKPVALITIDSTLVDSTKLKNLEDLLYGTDADDTQTPPTEATVPVLPLPSKIIEMFS